MTTSQHEPVLVLWDVDHTLVTIGTVSREVYERAFAEVVGLPLRELADMAGRTERTILTETLALHGIPNPDSKFDDFYAALAKAADQLRGHMGIAGRRLPGAVDAIAALAGHHVVQSVVTGNLKPIAVTKLEVFGIAALLDFEVGGYGSDADTRPPLIWQAWQRAQRKYGHTFEPGCVVVIGDTPHDVAAAREVGVRAVGVATGDSTADELTAAHANAVLADLTDPAAVVEAVYGERLSSEPLGSAEP